MRARLSKWSLIGLCVAMAAAIGGGFYEHIVLMPLWSSSPPSSFAVIQPETGVPLQRFWIPVHAAITVFLLIALVATWKNPGVRRPVLLGLASYVVMRIWSGAFFIPEMLDFQQVPLDAPASAELSARVEAWTRWSVWREPLDLLSFLSWLVAFGRLQQQDDVLRARHPRAA